MQDFVHLHVHTYFSILDGQANIKKLVDKAVGNGMRGMAITDHGNMFAIKEFFNYVNKKNGKIKGAIKDAEKALAKAKEESNNEEIEARQTEIESLKKKGVSVVYISHKMDEILRISDEVTIMRDGKYIGTWESKNLTIDTISFSSRP